MKPQPADPNLLSVIVPTYKCPTIVRDLKSITRYLDQLNRPYEVLCIVDGKAHARDTTLQKARKARSTKVSVYSYPQNRGKGYAVRYGMARAKGGLIAFIDAGSDLHASGIGMALEHLKWYEADIIIGSKRHKASKVTYPFKRRVISTLAQWAIRLFFGVRVSDTQTGLKLFRRQVLEQVLPRLVIKRFAFDLEILIVAHRLGFNRIYESPIELNYNFSSTINGSALYHSAVDFLAIIYRTYIIRHYDDRHQDIWEHDPKLALRYHS